MGKKYFKESQADVPDKNVGDTISRQAALKALEFAWAGKTAFDAIKALPSVEPERKKGEWEVYREYKQTIDGRTFDGWCECSNCHMMYRYEFQSVNFCPNCGAEMKGAV